ncbi:hypothetical protein CathTA2_2447 [Caldalkalibacillus thermarum TA2.A1]|uniref:Uncharacterized protein n=1 Tax=Caldalkalibacillus thermarum (strain TA2.A1) TaxID=986075 RepID=F5L9E2_CALTT|nr:hypothetical protein [Caldalkalibacillus thermarum]EGL82084.1 hypothetical protein CathTA2_2447 [Caldalkalibacillus thermarum TA2.A1]QZT34003.1 hypothetical protein HUR95_00755 [Caldalkalibacillus thermarum TA2.A1]
MSVDQEIREILKLMTREDLAKIAHDYIGFERYKGRCPEIQENDVENMSDDELRKWIAKRG